jgi:signal transduction histidine kinase
MTPSLRRRILLTVAPLLLLLAGIGGAGIVLLARLGQRGDAILRENYDSVRAMDRLSAAAQRIDAAFRFALAGREDEARAAYRAGWTVVDEQMAVEGANLTIYPDEPTLFAELQHLTTYYRERGDQFFAAPADGSVRPGYYAGMYGNRSLEDAYREVERVARAIHDLNENQMQRASRDARDTARTSVALFAAGLAVAALIAPLAVWWLQRTILGPIRAVTEAATAIGGGQLHLIVPVTGRDEVGRLAEAFNAMTAKLRAYRQTNTERLLRARETGQATIDSFADPVVVIDTLGRIESANPAAQRVLGVRPPPDGAPREPWVPPEALRSAVADALRQQRPVLAETFDRAVTFRLDGEDRVYLPQLRPIRSPTGEPLGAAVVLNDVTRFRLLDRLKSDWVATVSHELKTPLTSVRLAVHVLLEEVVGPLEPKQVELLVEARESTERLLKLIEHLLSLARLEDGREQLDLRPADPAELLRAAAEDVAARAEDKRIGVVVDAAPSLPSISVDSVRLGRALNNLLDNAVTYTAPGGTVTLAAAPTADGRVRVSVGDTGIGIPPEHLPHVFDRFFRVPGRDGTPGTGLGLAIVREVVAVHGGEIRCESEPGRGTTFHITLPAAEGGK